MYANQRQVTDDPAGPLAAYVQKVTYAPAVFGKGGVVPSNKAELDKYSDPGDFYDDDAPAVLKELLGGPADVVLSDMAASATGDPQIDHLRIMGLAEAAHAFAREILAPGGTFVA